MQILYGKLCNTSRRAKQSIGFGYDIYADVQFLIYRYFVLFYSKVKVGDNGNSQPRSVPNGKSLPNAGAQPKKVLKYTPGLKSDAMVLPPKDVMLNQTQPQLAALYHKWVRLPTCIF